MNTYLIIFFFMMISYSQGQATLIVKIVGFENFDGDLRIALSNTKESYLTDDVLIGKRVKVNSDTMTVKFENLEYGEYAVQAYHDADLDAELTTNFFGMPTERYTFSNNARSSFGPADYEDSKFILNKALIQMTLVLK